MIPWSIWYFTTWCYIVSSDSHGAVSKMLLEGLKISKWFIMYPSVCLLGRSSLLTVWTHQNDYSSTWASQRRAASARHPHERPTYEGICAANAGQTEPPPPPSAAQCRSCRNALRTTSSVVYFQGVVGCIEWTGQRDNRPRPPSSCALVYVWGCFSLFFSFGWFRWVRVSLFQA